VWNGKRIDCHVAHLERGASAENAAVEFSLKLALDGFHGKAVAKYRNLQFGAEHGQALNVVAVFVRNEDAVETFRRAANSKEAIADLPAAKAGIDEQASFFSFQISAIARRTTAQNREFDCHAPTLVLRNYQGNPFARRRKMGCHFGIDFSFSCAGMICEVAKLMPQIA